MGRVSPLHGCPLWERRVTLLSAGDPARGNSITTDGNEKNLGAAHPMIVFPRRAHLKEQWRDFAWPFGPSRTRSVQHGAPSSVIRASGDHGSSLSIVVELLDAKGHPCPW